LSSGSCRFRKKELLLLLFATGKYPLEKYSIFIGGGN
jgi:hypothetical protein